MRAASTSPQRTRSSMQYLRWSVTYGLSFHEGMPSSSITSRRQVFKKSHERAVELTGPFDVRDVARAFDDYETRALDTFTHRLGVGRRSDLVFASDDDERGHVYQREQVGLISAQRHAAQRGGRAFGVGSEHHLTHARDRLGRLLARACREKFREHRVGDWCHAL